MDQATLVENRIDGGRQLIEQLMQDGFDVTAAAWVRLSDEASAYLYIVTREVDDRGPAAAYRQFHTTMRRLGGHRVGPFDAKLVPVAGSIARAIVALRDRGSDTGAKRSQWAPLGDVPLDEAYVYPQALIRSLGGSSQPPC